MRVLLVDPDNDRREALAAEIGAHSETAVIEAASGAEALRATRWCGPLNGAVVAPKLPDLERGAFIEMLLTARAGLAVLALDRAGALREALAARSPVGLPGGDRGESVHDAFADPLPVEAADGLVLGAAGGEIRFANAEATKVLGDDLVGRSLESLSPDWKAPFPASAGWLVDVALPGGGVLHSCQTCASIYEPGSLFETVITLRPLASHCPRTPELRASEDRFRILLDELDVGVVIQDPDDRILVSNPKACELLGLTWEQLHGKSSFDPDWHVIREDGTQFDPSEHPSVLAMARGEPVRDVVMGVYRPATRDRVWILVNAEPARNATGEINRVIVTFSDISEYKAVKEQLERAHRLHTIGTLVAGIAHDFNNVLTAIIACVESLLVGETSPGKRRLAEDIFGAAQRGATFTRQLLTFAQEHTSHPEHLRVDRLVADLIPLLRKTLPRSLRIETDLAAGERTAWIGPGELERVILNLALNARDAQPDGGLLRITTAIEAGAEGQVIAIRVSDRGGGIPEELQARVFEPLFTTKSPEKGTGLGLAMVYGIVSGAGGTVELDSSSAGTTVTIMLPVSAEPEETAASAAGDINADGARTVLIVDDDELALEHTRRLLDEAGFAVIAAADGLDALGEIKRRRGQIDLVVTDLIMPGLSGAALGELAREEGIPVVFVSGYPERAKPATGQVVRKPLSRAELLNAVKGALDGAKPPA